MVIFVIPAYNEEQNIASLLEQTNAKMEALGLPYRILIIDDGSCDHTAEIVRTYATRLPVTVLGHDRNLGVGQVFRTGLHAALEVAHPGDVIVTKEADNTSDLGVLPQMLARIREGHQLVLASCYANGGGIVGTTWTRMALSSTANTLLRSLFPIKGVYTYSSFYRAYTYELLDRAFRTYGDRLLTERGFVCMVELLVKLAVLRPRIAEVPVTLRGDLRNGKSKMKVVRTMGGYAHFTLRHWTLWRRTR